MTDNSQCGEQERIITFFRDRHTGLFVDIGAGDGIINSNTRCLWDRGWNGILIEANPSVFARLVQNYAGSDRVVLINAAICNEDGPVTFYVHAIEGWCSMDRRWVKQQGGFTPLTVLGLRLETLKLPPKIDFLSIDTEGKDAEILENAPASFLPRMIVAESDKFDAPVRLHKCLSSRGYSKQWDTKANVCYARR